MADDANVEPTKQGTISQVYLKSNNAYYDVCDTKSRKDIASLLDKIYPIGSIYMTMDNNFSPQISFGGTWEKIQGKFLLGTSNNGASNAEGGNSQITLAENQVPMKQHTHSMAHTHNISHTHGMGHTHTISHKHNVDISHEHALNDCHKDGDHYARTLYSSRKYDFSGSNGGYTEGGMYGGQGLLVTFPDGDAGHGVRVQPANPKTKTTGNPDNTNSGNSSRDKTTDASSTTSGISSESNTGQATVSGSSQNISPVNILPPYITVHMWRRTA